jgi:hypothetical protein
MFSSFIIGFMAGTWISKNHDFSVFYRHWGGDEHRDLYDFWSTWIAGLSFSRSQQPHIRGLL